MKLEKMEMLVLILCKSVEEAGYLNESQEVDITKKVGEVMFGPAHQAYIPCS